MASLFGNLPAPTGAKRPAEEPPFEQSQEGKRLRPDEEGPGAAADASGQPHPSPVPAAALPQPSAAAAAAAPQPAKAAPPLAQQQDQVAAALRKIAGHITHPKKFAKASELLRALMAEQGPGALRQEHMPLLFSALKAAMRDPQQAAEPGLAREYSKLFTAASKHAESFTIRERTQLDVYGIWAVLRNQLTTDDSFQFNKVVGRLKEMAAALPEASEADDEALQRLQEKASEPDPVLEESPPAAAAAAAAAPEPEAPAAAPAAAPEPVAAETAATAAEQQQQEQQELDPFGLDALLDAPPPPPPPPPSQAPPPPPPRRKSVTWSSDEALNMRRVALLDCVDTCKACYRNAWARTSVDLLIEHLHKLAERFAPSQRPRLEAFMRFVRDQRRIRKLGPSAKEVARDTTSFEMARAEWAKQSVSARGKVGAGGDHKSEMWLG